MLWPTSPLCPSSPLYSGHRSLSWSLRPVRPRPTSETTFTSARSLRGQPLCLSSVHPRLARDSVFSPSWTDGSSLDGTFIMALFHEPAIASSHCRSKAKRDARLTLDREVSGPRLSRLKSISVPALSDVVWNSLAWVGDTCRGGLSNASGGPRRLHPDAADRKEILHLRMRSAVSYSEWRDCACELDELEGNNNWKETFQCSEYNPCLVKERLEQLEEARISCDTSRMLFQIRTSLRRDLGNMSNAALYQHAHFGTKDLIDRYITTAVETISSLVDHSVKSRCDGREMRHVLEQLLETRQAFGRSALLLSGGGTWGMSHIGVIKALWEAKLLPRIISGASAGSVVSAILCCHTEDEIPELLDTYASRDMRVFSEESMFEKCSNFLKFGAFMDITNLANSMRSWLGDITFQEAYNRTRRILNIGVSCANTYELPRLLNYITAPNVLVWSAVTVSCSVPLVFTPPVLMAKDPVTGDPVPWNGLHKHYIDGSVDGDLPMNRLSEMFNVNHFIVSQVNPHVVPFLPKETYPDNKENPTDGRSPGWFPLATELAKDELLHRLNVAADMGIFPNALTKIVSVVNQKYSGDINIYPQVTIRDVPYILNNPSPEYLERIADYGERATWPKLGRIRNHCAIELALDSAIQQMRARVTFNFSQKELRVVGLPRDLSGSFDEYPSRPSNRRSSYSHDQEQPKLSEADRLQQSRPPFRRTCSTASSQQPHVVDQLGSNLVDGLADLPSDDQRYGSGFINGTGAEPVAPDGVPKRPAMIKRLATWSPLSHDRLESMTTPQGGQPSRESSAPLHSRPSKSNLQHVWASATEISSEGSPAYSKLSSSSQSYLLQMTPTSKMSLSDPPTSQARLQACNSG